MAEEQESGDGTNLCVSLGGELLLRAEELLKEGIHANDVYKGYELARDKALEVLNKQAGGSTSGILKSVN